MKNNLWGLTPDTQVKHPVGRVEAGTFFSCPGDNMQPGFRISALEKTSEDNIMGLFKNHRIGWYPVLFFTFSSNIHEERETACFAAGGAF